MTRHRFGFHGTDTNDEREELMNDDKSMPIENQSSDKSEHSRRHFLRGAAGLLALPWLESLSRADATVTSSPKRFAFIYTPNGYNQATFLPETTGRDWDLPPALEPLTNLRDRVSLVTGLDREFVPGTGVHAQCGSCWLTSSAPQETLDGGFPTNITLDQMIARRISGETPLPSLELSCNDFTNSKETKYFESISWYGPGHAAKTEKNPREVFQRLFGKPDGDVLNRSVLDKVHADAKRLATQLGAADREKLDEYLDSVRQTERRIQLAEQAAARIGQPPLPEPTGIPEHRGEYLRLMGDLIVHAFRLDLTRVATLVVDPERWDSPRMFHGVFDAPQNHHVLTHTKGDEAKVKITQIDRFHVALYAYVVAKLQGIREGEGTLLDSCCIAMGSGISDGGKHNYADLQVLLAGGLTPQVGHLHYPGRRPLADLWLTLADSAGVSLERFADSTGTLEELI
ncbi:MAG: DUF1552 domain-containing protein [Planctomycetota bacterium]|nr:DUF1552 domain-containing protein [Planctomycetota bacterium]